MHTLQHSEFRAAGIFGSFTFDGDDAPFMATLEHAFLVDGEYEPIIGPGTYSCVRGQHELDDGTQFETFEITGVDGHSGLLFHWGNYNRDSKGCVLTGQQETGDMITNSRNTFAAFMQRLDGVDTFELEVVCN